MKTIRMAIVFDVHFSEEKNPVLMKMEREDLVDAAEYYIKNNNLSIVGREALKEVRLMEIKEKHPLSEYMGGLLNENEKVVIRPEEFVEAGDLCQKLLEQAQRIGPGSAAVDRIEWKAMRVIQALLRERNERSKSSV